MFIRRLTLTLQQMAIDCRFALSTTEAWEPSTLALKLKIILEDLRKKMKDCIRYIGKPVLCCVTNHICICNVIKMNT